MHLKLFDILELGKVLKLGERCKASHWPDEHFIVLIGEVIIYSTPSFTTEYKFSIKDFNYTWEQITNV